MRLVALLLVAAACDRTGSGGTSGSVIVTALAGDRAEPGATVISHAADGTVIAQTATDAVGRAEVGVEDDSLVSVVFPGNITAVTPIVSVVTVMAPGAELSVHGPSRATAPLIVGVLQLDGPNLAGATYFEIRLGCATVRATTLPVNIDVGACSMGSDTNLDVLVRGYHDVGGDPPAPVLDGYAAGRARLSNGVAQLVIDTWHTTAPTVPVSVEGDAYVELTLYADGLPFDTQAVTTEARIWTGLEVDASITQATLAGANAASYTQRRAPGVPAAIRFTAADFLPAIDRTTSLASEQPLSIAWDGASIGADAINLHVTWQPNLTGVVPLAHRVVWDAVLPPDATSVTLPILDGDLGITLAHAGILGPDVVLRYLDSGGHEGFAALVGAGIHAEETIQASTIAVPPADGDMRVSHAIGLR